MNQFDTVDFSNCRLKEVMSFFRHSLYDPARSGRNWIFPDLSQIEMSRSSLNLTLYCITVSADHDTLTDTVEAIWVTIDVPAIESNRNTVPM